MLTRTRGSRAARGGTHLWAQQISTHYNVESKWWLTIKLIYKSFGKSIRIDSVFVCILNENGILFQEKFGVLTPDLESMVVALHEYEATEVCMESTSIYWLPVWRVLEPYFSLKLVNPFFIKQLPGKKSDIKDAEWIATCLLKDLICGSYVPEDRIQQLRQYDRRIFDLSKEIVYKLTNALCGLGRPFELLVRRGNCYIIFSPLSLIVEGTSCTYEKPWRHRRCIDSMWSRFIEEN